MERTVTTGIRWAALAVALLTAGRAPAQPAPAAPVAPPAAPAPAPAATPPLAEALTGEAKDDYELGRQLFEKGDYASAMVKFRRAHELSGDARLLWNMAVCETKLHRYARVIATLARWRKEAGAALTEEDLRQAEALEQASRKLVSELTLTVNEPGAQVLIDDEAVGTTPLAQPVLLDAGARRIRITKRGFKEQVRLEQVDGGGELALSIQLEREAKEGRLVVVSRPGAQITLDGRALGVGRWEGPVPSGGHTLRVTAPGMAPYQAEIVVSDNQVRRLEVELRPPEPRGGIPAWVWIAGGVALAAGAVTAGAVLLQPEPRAPITGTLGSAQSSFGGRW